MTRRFILLVWAVLGHSSFLQAQWTSAWGHIGGSYIREAGSLSDEEYTLRIAVGADLWHRWSIGLKAHRIFYRTFRLEWERMWLAGPFVRGGIFPSERIRIYGEAGFYVGNYCTCGVGLAPIFRDDGILYLSIGGGAEIRIRNGWFLDLGIMAHELVNRPQPKFGYNVYFVGVMYRIGDVAWKPDFRLGRSAD